MDTYISLEKYKLHFLHSVRCTEDIGIENGEAVCSDGNFYGSLCVFECEPGYSLRGTTTMTCENFGWNNPSPFCERGRLHVAAKFKKVGSVAKELGLLCCKNSCDKCMLVKKKKKKYRKINSNKTETKTSHHLFASMVVKYKKTFQVVVKFWFRTILLVCSR